MFQKVSIFLLLQATAVSAYAQDQKTDSVIVPLANTSKVIFTMKDRSDLEILKHYDFQELFEDILKRIENGDTTAVGRNSKVQPTDTLEEEKEEDTWDNPWDTDDDDTEEDDYRWEHHRSRIGRTWQSFTFDLGTNNYLSNGKFPDQDNALYAVRPWGSWYFAASSVQRTRLARKFFIEWGLGISWYTFKFQRHDAIIEKDDTEIRFVADSRDVDHIKSKLSATYLQASFVPVVDFRGSSRKPRMWNGRGNEFRVGAGPYAGYRISSWTKHVYEEGGDRQKDKSRDSFYLNNIRYGARLQIGFRSTDLFFNYDLNELFTKNKGPALNAFSFGLIF